MEISDQSTINKDARWVMKKQIFSLLSSVSFHLHYLLTILFALKPYATLCFSELIFKIFCLSDNIVSSSNGICISVFLEESKEYSLLLCNLKGIDIANPVLPFQTFPFVPDDILVYFVFITGQALV